MTIDSYFGTRYLTYRLAEAFDLVKRESLAIMQAAEAQKAKEASLQQTEDPLKDRYGDLPLIQSQNQTGRHWLAIKDVDDSSEGKLVGDTLLPYSYLVQQKSEENLLALLERARAELYLEPF